MNKAGDRRLFGGWASVEVIDKQGELVDMDAFRESMKAFMDMGGNIIDMHTNKKIAKVLKYKFAKKDDKDALWLDMEAYKLYDYHDMVWKKIKNGEYKGLSMGGRRKKGEFALKCDDNGCHNHVKGIELFEVSVVDNPANPEATIEQVNSMAKADRPLTFSMICPEGNESPCEDCTIANKSVIDIMKPEAFDRCVATLEDDPDIDSPHAVCTAAMKGENSGNPSNQEDTKTGGTQMTEEEVAATTKAEDGTPPEKEEVEKNPMEERIAALEQGMDAILAQMKQNKQEEDEKPEDEPTDEDDKNKGDAPLTAKDMESLKTSIEEVKKTLTALKAPAPTEDSARPDMAKTAPEVDAEVLDIQKAAEDMTHQEIAEKFPN